MTRVGKIAPASLWRAFFVGALAFGAALPPAMAATGGSAASPRPDAAETARILEHVRRSGIAGDYYLEFTLHALPRRGAERVYQGRMWGSRNEQGAISRVELKGADGATQRLLVQNGGRATVWRLNDGRAAQLNPADLFAPILPNVELTAFDLQMPYLYWPDAKLQGIDKVRGREAYTFVFRAPEKFNAGNSKIAAARVSVDTQFNTMAQTELLDAAGKALKKFSPLSLQQVAVPGSPDRHVVPKAVDFRNEVSRDKARLQVNAVALGLELAPTIFAPATLAEDVRPPAAKLVRID